VKRTKKFKKKREGGSGLVIKLTEHGHTTLHPVVFGQVRRDKHPNDIVGGVTRGREHTAPFTRLVHRDVVHAFLVQVLTLAWLHPDLKCLMCGFQLVSLLFSSKFS